MATRASQQPISGPILTATQKHPILGLTLMTTPLGSPERWRLAHSDCSKLSLYRVLTLMVTPSKSTTYVGSYPDGYTGTTYSGSYPDDYHLGSLLKDGDSPTMIARSSAYIGSRPDGYSMSQQLISGRTLTAIPRRVS